MPVAGETYGEYFGVLTIDLILGQLHRTYLPLLGSVTVLLDFVYDIPPPISSPPIPKRSLELELEQ